MKLSHKTILASLLIIFALGSLSSCASRKYQTEWMDVDDTKRLDKLKGKRSKKLQKQAHRYPKSTNRNRK